MAINMDNDDTQWRLTKFSVSKGYMPGEGPIRFDVPIRYKYRIFLAHVTIGLISFAAAMLATQGAAFWIAKKWGRSEHRKAVQEKNQEKDSKAECPSVEYDSNPPPAEKLVYSTSAVVFFQALHHTAEFSLTKAITCGIWEDNWDGTFPMTAAAAAASFTLVAVTAICCLLAWAFRKNLWFAYKSLPILITHGWSDSEENTNDSAQRSIFRNIWNKLCAIPKLLFIWFPLWILSAYTGMRVGQWLWPYVGHQWLEPLFNYS